MLELSRYLLVQGVTLVYGGHLGSQGYTEKLTELVRTHNQFADIDPVERIVNYVGWPIPLSRKQRADYKYIAKLKRVARPDDIDENLNPDFTEEPDFFPAEKSPEHRYAWARGMTAMRMLETKETVARIVLGGTFGPTLKTGPDGSQTEKWYASRIPGVLEEIMTSVEAGQPVFLVGWLWWCRCHGCRYPGRKGSRGNDLGLSDEKRHMLKLCEHSIKSEAITGRTMMI